MIVLGANTKLLVEGVGVHDQFFDRLNTAIIFENAQLSMIGLILPHLHLQAQTN